MSDEPTPKESMYGSDAGSVIGGGRRKKGTKRGGTKMKGLFDTTHGGNKRRGHGSRRRKSGPNNARKPSRKTARRR
jgi:hypothetical protein